jgi:hypothetical protein
VTATGTTYSVTVTNAAGCTGAAATGTITVNALPSITSLTANPATICNGQSATLTASATGATSYSIDNISWQPATTFSVNPTATTNYTLYVKSTAGCTATKANAATVTVNALPTISLASGSTAQTVTTGSAITEIKYNTSNATGVTPSNLPAGVSGTWSANVYTISGTPTSSGIYNYTVTTTYSNGCPASSATGTITVQSGFTYSGCTTPALTLGEVGFSSTATYVENGVIISSPVTATYCIDRPVSAYDGGSICDYKPDCASGNGFHWFSWCLVTQYAHQLCPSPWRVPNKDDFCTITNGSAENCNGRAGDWRMRWGDNYAGLIIGNQLAQETRGTVWHIEETSRTQGAVFYFYVDTVAPYVTSDKNRGQMLRCVQ